MNDIIERCCVPHPSYPESSCDLPINHVGAHRWIHGKVWATVGACEDTHPELARVTCKRHLGHEGNHRAGREEWGVSTPLIKGDIVQVKRMPLAPEMIVTDFTDSVVHCTWFLGDGECRHGLFDIELLVKVDA